MSDRNSDPGPAAGYGLPNQAAPLPRQWQLQRGMAPLPPRANASVQQQFHPGAAGAADWCSAAATRPTERAILIGLWLLVMLAAVVVGLRFLDLSALTVTPTDLAVRPAAAAAAADAARAAAYAAVLANDDPMFDDPVPVAAPVPPAPVVIVQAGHPGDACPHALRAMQLCSAQSR